MEKQMITDIHMHVVPDVDDGADDLDMSLEMLRMSAEQGVKKVFCTSHSWFSAKDRDNYLKNFEALKKAARENGINIELYTGNEIYCDMYNIMSVTKRLEDGILLPLNGTKHVLLEFESCVDGMEMMMMCGEVMRMGWTPVIAHAERYYDILPHTISDLAEAGCLVQVNAYSLREESDPVIRLNARELLRNNLIHFIGSDAHKTTHRSPKISTGIEYLRENTTEEYYQKIISENAESYLF